MTDLATLKVRVVVLWVLSHIGLFFWTSFIYFLGNIRFEDFTTTLLLMAPLFTGVTTMIVKDLRASAAAGAAAQQTRQVPWAFAFVTLAFICAFWIYLFAIITLFGFNIGFTSFEQFKHMLGVSEVAFGIYIGNLMPTLFT